MTRFACKLCVLTKGITLRDTFATEADLLAHIEREHAASLGAEARLSVLTPRGLFDKGAASTALIPVADLQAIAERYKLAQVILVAWDGSREHVVTYGTTLGDADNAAQGGNLVKNALHWPPSRYSTSERVATLAEHANALLDRLSKNASDPIAKTDHWREFAMLRDFLVSEGFRS